MWFKNYFLRSFRDVSRASFCAFLRHSKVVELIVSATVNVSREWNIVVTCFNFVCFYFLAEGRVGHRVVLLQRDQPGHWSERDQSQRNAADCE